MTARCVQRSEPRMRRRSRVGVGQVGAPSPSKSPNTKKRPVFAALKNSVELVTEPPSPTTKVPPPTLIWSSLGKYPSTRTTSRSPGMWTRANERSVESRAGEKAAGQSGSRTVTVDVTQGHRTLYTITSRWCKIPETIGMRGRDRRRIVKREIEVSVVAIDDSS